MKRDFSTDWFGKENGKKVENWYETHTKTFLLSGAEKMQWMGESEVKWHLYPRTTPKKVVLNLYNTSFFSILYNTSLITRIKNYI